MAEIEFTADELETIIVGALKARDFDTIAAALHVLAIVDAKRAVLVRDTMLAGITLGKVLAS